jgi:hypothetical protein
MLGTVGRVKPDIGLKEPGSTCFPTAQRVRAHSDTVVRSAS